jgi:hypothetical protein
MTHYEPSTPRAACAIAAVAMTVLTLGMAVVLPASSDPGGVRVYVVAAPEPIAPVTSTTPGLVQTGFVTDCERRDSIQARNAERSREQEG